MMIARPSAIRDFLNKEAAGGIILLAAAILAMVVANGPFSESYFQALHARIGPMSVLHWINDGLMAIFFLLVGLEIKREFIGGHLASWRSRALPAIAAASGMTVPALVFLFFAGSVPGLARGWAIPAATDIAFAIGVMALLGSRVPTSLKLFLTTVAIVDDMGAVAIIALAYTNEIHGLALLAAAAVMGVMFILNRMGVRQLWPYLSLAFLLWLAVLFSGVHATVAGVLAASLIPARAAPGSYDSADAPLNRLEHGLHRYVAYGIIPLFGFANAGVPLTGLGLDDLLAPLPLGVAAGLFVGKQAGIFSALWLCVRSGLAKKPDGASWAQVYGMCILCGIGFTMSLFIGGLAFSDAAHMDQVKIGVLCGSVLSALAGSALLLLAAGKRVEGKGAARS